MKESLVMTIIGKDRPGLVESLAATIEEYGGNWEESRMVRLAGEFAGLLRVHVDGERAGALTEALRGLAGISVEVARATEEEAVAADSHVLLLDVVGQDHPGIVHGVSEAIAALGINIEELETELVSAPMSGGTLFQATARLRAPRSVTLEALKRDLERLADDLMVDVHLDEAGGPA